jgi:predicted methyltransferase
MTCVRLASLAALAIVAALTFAASAQPTSIDVEALIANPIRTDGDRRMDASRKPDRFLGFIQVQPGMEVLDVSAGGGYTTQLLALAVGPKGKVWAQTPKPGPTLVKRLADNPQPSINVVTRPFDDPVPPEAGKLDLITLVNNYHDIVHMNVDRTRMNALLFAALKPGGRMVVVDHSARAGTGITEGKTIHRIDEAVVKEELGKAGFVLDAEGSFLRNPDDARTEHSYNPKVPTDKFALRFVKPQ